MKKFKEIREARQLDEYGANEWNVYVKVASKRAWREIERSMASLDSWIESHWDTAKKMAKFTFNQDKHTGSERRKAGEFIKKTKGVEFSHAVKEDVPANNASSGAVAGLGSEPPVSKAAQKKKKKMARRSMPGGMGEAVIKSMDSKAALNVYNKLKKGSKVTVEFGGAMSSTKEPLELVVSSPHRVVGKSKVGRIILKNPNNMRGMKYTLYNRNGNITLAQGDMATILKDLKVVKESVELDEYRRKDVYVIVDKKGKVVASNLTKQNAHKEISRHRDGTIVLDPDAKTGDVLKTFAKESVELDEVKATARNIVKGLSDADGPFTVVAIKRNKVIKQENTKRRDMLPAIVKMMRKEVGSGVTIGIEDKKGTIRGTFKEAYTPKQKEAIEKVKDILFRKNKIGFYTAVGKIMVSPKDEKKANELLNKAFGGDFTKKTGLKVKAGRGPKRDFKINSGSMYECWDTHVQKGYKMKGGKRVPNCVPKNQVSEDTFAGCKVFKVSSEEYSKCTHPRVKNERWKKKLNMEMRDEIRQYAHRNPGKPVIVQDETSGMMSYLILKKEE